MMNLPVPRSVLKAVNVLISRIINVAEIGNFFLRQLCCVMVETKEVSATFDLGFFAIREIGQSRTTES